VKADRVIPILRVADWERAVAWYRQLGFEMVGEEPHRFAPGLPAFLTIENGPAAMYLSEHEGDARPGTLVYLWVDEVDPIAEHFGVTPDDMPWARDFEISDPDGNRIRVAEHRDM